MNDLHGEDASSKPNVPTELGQSDSIGRRVDSLTKWARTEWTKRSAEDARFKWIAAGTVCVASLVAILLFLKLMSVVFGPSIAGKPSREAYEQLDPRMGRDRVYDLIGAPSITFRTEDPTAYFAVWTELPEGAAIVIKDLVGDRFETKRWDAEGEWKAIRRAAGQDPTVNNAAAIPNGKWRLATENGEQTWEFTVEGSSIKGMSYRWNMLGKSGGEAFPGALPGSSIRTRGKYVLADLGRNGDGAMGSFELQVDGNKIRGKTTTPDTTSLPVNGEIKS